MRVVLLVPRRDDGGHRDRLWEWCRARWERYFPDLPIYEGHHDDGPFNRSAAINRAARIADADGRWDIGIVIDSDVFLTVRQVRKAIATAQRTGRVTWGHRRWRGFSEDQTRRVIHPRDPIDFGPDIDRDDMDIYVERTNPISWSCFVAFPRPVWDAIGGFDERFVGWGFEDMAVKALVTGLHGWERIDADVYHLWHPRSGERIVKGQPAETATPEYLMNARLGRRYMVAVIRDHGIGDQPGEERLSPEMRAKHVANLQRDDQKLIPYARRYGLPDLTGWWPTLAELRDGAIAHRDRPVPEPTITVIVHTGGEPDAWPQRSAYLRTSLASLADRVTGPVVQRVVYSDWGPALHDAVVAIAGERGFYVAGDGHHGYTGSMRRMWAYLAKRGQADFVFATEDDFVYDRDVDLTALASTLRENSYLRQVALLRAPYYPREIAAGGVLAALDPTAFVSVSANGHSRIEHRDHWTANPAMFRRSVTATPWPVAKSSERVYGDLLLRDPRARFAYWGSGEPWVSHIGAVRAGTGY